MGNARIQLRRGTAAFWTSENPILFPGEPGYEKDTGKLKVGDGVTPWRGLDYISSADDIPDDLEDEIRAIVLEHINALEPHPVYDDGPSLVLLYENAKV